MSKAKAICVCGKSKIFPICDGSHHSANWSCQSKQNWAKIGFCASPRYQNIALKCADHYKGANCLAGESYPQLDTLIIITDGTDLQFPSEIYPKIQAQKSYVITLGIHGHFLSNHFPQSKIITAPLSNPLHAFKTIKTKVDLILKGKSSQENLSSSAPKNIFLSHAVRDETNIMPVVEYLRDYLNVNIFVCTDSIGLGTNWHQEIIQGLHKQEHFVALISKSYLASHFCSFEIGMAFALKKTINFISLDGYLPHVFVQHLQCIDLPRLKTLRPWLEIEDILLDELGKIALGYTTA